MYKTSYNNYKNNFLPFFISNQTNSDGIIKNRKLNNIQKKSLSRNKKMIFNDKVNNKIQLYKKMNPFKTSKFPLDFTNNSLLAKVISLLLIVFLNFRMKNNSII